MLSDDLLIFVRTVEKLKNEKVFLGFLHENQFCINLRKVSRNEVYWHYRCTQRMSKSNNQEWRGPCYQELGFIFHGATEEVAIEYLVENGALIVPDVCRVISQGGDICGGSLCDTGKQKGQHFQCNKRTCRKRVSIFSNTFFEGSKLLVGQILEISYLYCIGASFSAIRQFTHSDHATVTAWSRYLRQAITYDLVHDPLHTKIGGPGVVVELDESKFGKRKYNRGHAVEGVWVVGGVERTPERRMFAVSVADRSAPTLLDVIERHVHPGSIVFTDCWKGYNTEGLLEMGMMEHKTVNHSETYVDPDSGCCTNSIEGTWAGIKLRIPARNRNKDDVDERLLEFIWRRKYNGRNAAWQRLLYAIGHVVYQEEEG